jgi:signal transduction histidine kinase
MLLSPSIQRLNKLVDWFLPARVQHDRESRQQARMFLFSHLFGPFIGNTVPLALYLLDPTPGIDVAVLAASITLFWTLPFMFRAYGHYNALVLISVQNLVFVILVSCYFLGGVSSPTLPWVLIIPLLTFFYLGPNLPMGFVVLGLFMLNLTAFAVMSAIGTPPESDLSPAALQGLGTISTIGTCVYVVMMALYYGKILAAGSELEGEVRRHHATAKLLRQSTAAAEDANLAKSEFLAKMSHELRSPLNAIIGYAEMLLDGAVAEGDRQSVSDIEKIRGHSLYLLKLINAVLDLSKLEAGRMQLFNEPAALHGLVAAAVEEVRPLVERNHNRIAVALGNDLGIASLDGPKLQRALAQLLDNAAKFTHEGAITVRAARVRTAAGEELALEVADTGIGIAPEDLPNVFEKFSMVHNDNTIKYGGAGLGLLLSQKLVRLMGGRMSVESEVGKGSRFAIRLPIRGLEARAQPEGLAVVAPSPATGAA